MYYPLCLFHELQVITREDICITNIFISDDRYVCIQLKSPAVWIIITNKLSLKSDYHFN